MRGWAAGTLTLAASMISLGAALPGCDREGARQAPTVLRRGNGAEPESLDPHHARSEAALTILRDLYEGLTELGPDGTPRLAAADRFTVSRDGLTYRFHLRERARCSNGEPVVAEDFTAAWRRLVDPRTGSQYAQLLAPVEGAEAITQGSAAAATLNAHAPEPSTVEVRLAHPAPYFLSILAHPATFPINRPVLEQRGSSFAKPGIMVSNGAFVLTRWDFGSHLVAARNPAYWNVAATQLDGVEYYSITEPAAELRAFRRLARAAAGAFSRDRPRAPRRGRDRDRRVRGLHLRAGGDVGLFSPRPRIRRLAHAAAHCTSKTDAVGRGNAAIAPCARAALQQR